MDTGSQQATVHGVTRVGYDITTKPPPSPLFQWLLQLIPPVIPFVMINNKKKILLDKVKMKTLSWVRQFVTPWNFPGQNTGVGSLSLLQGIFPIQGSNPGLPQCRQILYQLSHKMGREIDNYKVVCLLPFSLQIYTGRQGSPEGGKLA